MLLFNSVCKTASVQVPELLMKRSGSSRKPSAPAPVVLKVRSKEEKTFQGFSFSRKLSKQHVPGGHTPPWLAGGLARPVCREGMRRGLRAPLLSVGLCWDLRALV